MEIRYDDLVLRPTTEADIDFVMNLEANPENAKFISAWTRGKHQEALSNPDMFHGVVMNNNQRSGYVILAGLQNANKSIEFMRVVVGEKEKGLGRKILKATKKHCFETLNAHRLWLDVKTFNERAKHLYQSEGFIIEGTFRECLKVGENYESLAFLSMLAREYR